MSLIGVPEQALPSGKNMKYKLKAYQIPSRAAAYSFQKPPDVEQGINAEEPQLRHSALQTYLGIDKRDGLTSMGRHLLKGKHFKQPNDQQIVSFR